LFKSIAAAPIAVAIERNLPICEETVFFGSNEYSQLLVAYWVSLLDTYRYLKGEIPVLSKDLPSILDMKQALAPKEVEYPDKVLACTWTNAGESLLDFLAESAYPMDTEGVSCGYFGAVGTGDVFPTLVSNVTTGVTDEIVQTNFTKYYVQLVMQIAGANGETVVTPSDYESEFAQDTSLWAYVTPETDDIFSHLSKFGTVTHYVNIPPTSEWLGLMPMVVDTTSNDAIVRARYTGFAGVVQYVDRLDEGISGRISRVVEPGFIDASQIGDRFLKEVLTGVIDYYEMFSTDEFDVDDFFENYSRMDFDIFVFNVLNFIYSRSSFRFCFDNYAFCSTIGGMETIPNVNFGSAMMQADILENLCNLGPVEEYRVQKGRARVVKIPYLYFGENKFSVSFGQDDLSYLSDMFHRAEVEGSFGISSPAGINIGLLNNRCYTRGTEVQEVWYSLLGNLMPLANEVVFKV
jgi:hypothetical protein